MTYSFLSFTNSENNSIEYKSILGTSLQVEFPEDPIDLILNHQITEVNIPDPLNANIKHWLNRKWQVSLDYYLSSPNTEKMRPRSATSSSIKTDINLPQEDCEGKLSPIVALMSRKTHRRFASRSLPISWLSMILKEVDQDLFSDIWIYYIIIFDVEDVEAGIYRYSSKEHGLALIKKGCFREDVVDMLCGMSASRTASFLVVLSIDIQKAFQNYPYNRALREIYITSGRIAQKLVLKGMQNYIGALPSPAMHDTAMCKFLGINPNECIPIYSVTMGIIYGAEVS